MDTELANENAGAEIAGKEDDPNKLGKEGEDEDEGTNKFEEKNGAAIVPVEIEFEEEDPKTAGLVAETELKVADPNKLEVVVEEEDVNLGDPKAKEVEELLGFEEKPPKNRPDEGGEIEGKTEFDDDDDDGEQNGEN